MGDLFNSLAEKLHDYLRSTLGMLGCSSVEKKKMLFPFSEHGQRLNFHTAWTSERRPAREPRLRGGFVYGESSFVTLRDVKESNSEGVQMFE